MTDGAVKDEAQAGLEGAARFTGRYPGKVDSKGRIVIPAEFRQRLGTPEVFCFPSLVEPVLQCGPAALVDDLLEAVAGMDVYDEERWAIEEEITGGVMRLAIDDTGRAILPKDLKIHAEIEGPAGFAGRGRHFVLATADYLDIRKRRGRELAVGHRETLRARMLPSVSAGRKR